MHITYYNRYFVHVYTHIGCCRINNDMSSLQKKVYSPFVARVYMYYTCTVTYRIILGPNNT